MLSVMGFSHHLENVSHYTKMHEVYKDEVSLKAVEDSKQILSKAFKEQAEKVERYEKALKEIASANNEISKASCPRIARQELYK